MSCFYFFFTHEKNLDDQYKTLRLAQNLKDQIVHLFYLIRICYLKGKAKHKLNFLSYTNNMHMT